MSGLWEYQGSGDRRPGARAGRRCPRHLAFARELLPAQVDEPPLPLVIGGGGELYQKARLNLLAEIHEGLKVRVLGEREGWLQVSLASGLTGWIQKEQIETI